MKKELVLKKRKMMFLWLGKGLSYSFIIVFFLYLTIINIFPSLGIKVFGFRHFVFSSTGMQPTLNLGDIIVVRPIELDQLQEGMIICYYQDVNLDGKNKVVTHYFVKEEIINGKVYYRTKRENATHLDSWRILPQNVIGVYYFKIPYLGKLTLFFRHPLGFRIVLIDIILLALIAIVIKWDQFPKFKRDKILKETNVS